MHNHDIEQGVFEQIFKNHAVKIRVILRASKTKGADFDKFRNVGYQESYQNPLFIKALTRTLSPNSLIIRELGLAETGALAIIIPHNDLALLKLSEVVIIDDVEYTPWTKALGGKMQVEKLPFKYQKIILFRINK